MHKARYIIIGLALFVLATTAPFWYNAVGSRPQPVLSLNTPAINQLAGKQCIEDSEFMRKNHMKLLRDWKEQSVRQGKTEYVAQDGRTYPVSLEKNCLSCHSNKQEFCDSCHSFAGIDTPNCWSCHVAPEGGQP